MRGHWGELHHQTCLMWHQQQAAGSGKAAPFHLAGQEIHAPESWKGGGSQDTKVSWNGSGEL